MFQLTDEELRNWKSQIVMSKSIKMGLRNKPYAFTEQGIAMLSGLLNSDIAIDTNIRIMRAFVIFRQYILSYAELKREFDEYMNNTDMRFNDIYQVLDELITHKKELEKPSNPIGFVLREE
jgi:hypothetical protein